MTVREFSKGFDKFFNDNKEGYMVFIGKWSQEDKDKANKEFEESCNKIRERVIQKYFAIEYNNSKSAQHPNKDEDIVRAANIHEIAESKDKEPLR